MERKHMHGEKLIAIIGNPQSGETNKTWRNWIPQTPFHM